MSTTTEMNNTMKLTKAQKEILAEIVMYDGEVNNYSQRLRSITPLLDAGIIQEEIVYDKDGLSRWMKYKIVSND
mgnify:CR=1 FL=1|jgi:hypothetical protein